MGLDQYAYAVKRDHIANPDAVVDLKPTPDAKTLRLAYWRKFNALHGWMEDLYRAKGGAQEFNCATVRIDEADLDKLERELDAGTLEPRAGFFFGPPEYTAEDVADTRRFIAMARTALAIGGVVFYDSWW
jgi:hypothetical protein